jgi:hypothetical protein
MIMPTPKIIEIDEDQDVVKCPICSIPAIDEDGLVSQPSCPHISFVYANAEAFEYDPEGLEERLNAAQEKADEEGVYFDPWEWLSASEETDVILEQVSESMACGSLTFTTWIGIRETPKDSRSRLRLVGAALGEEYTPNDSRVFFCPTKQFLRFMTAHHDGKHVYEVGCGAGGTASMLAKAGMNVTAIDLVPRSESEFPVVQGDSTQHQFEKDSVVLICRPCHDGFVLKTITNAIQRHVAAIVYVGLNANFTQDVGSIHETFTKRRIGVVGHAGERVWELNVKRLRAEASLRRSIPRLSPYILH